MGCRQDFQCEIGEGDNINSSHDTLYKGKGFPLTEQSSRDQLGGGAYLRF